MRLTLAFILLSAAFLGGYYLGHLPNSPDIFGWAQKTYAQGSDAYQKLSSVVKGEPGNVSETVAPKEMTVTVDGKTYKIGEKYQSDLAGHDKPPQDSTTK